MKKLLIILALLSVSVFAQNTDKPLGSNYTTTGILAKVMEDSAEVMRVKLYGQEFDNRIDSLCTDTLIVSGDTTVINNTELAYNTNKKFYFNGVKAWNKGANADTIAVTQASIYGDTYLGAVGLIDEETGLPVSNPSLIIIEANDEKRFRFISPYAGRIKVAPPVATGQAADKVIVEFWGM